jgi:hypothetical protein
MPCITSVAIPEPSQPRPQAESHRAGRLLLLVLVSAEAAWVAGLGYLLIRVLLLG